MINDMNCIGQIRHGYVGLEGVEKRIREITRQIYFSELMLSLINENKRFQLLKRKSPCLDNSFFPPFIPLLSIFNVPDKSLILYKLAAQLFATKSAICTYPFLFGVHPRIVSARAPDPLKEIFMACKNR